jgi:hypothetical protein
MCPGYMIRKSFLLNNKTTEKQDLGKHDVRDKKGTVGNAVLTNTKYFVTNGKVICRQE